VALPVTTTTATRQRSERQAPHMTDIAVPDPGDEPAAVAAQAARPQTPATADMTQLVTRIDRAVKQRRDSDTTLMNYWLYFFVVSWVTLGIYGLVLFFKRIGRIDKFTSRKRDYYSSLIDWTERYAQQQGKQDAVHHELQDLRGEIAAAYKGNLRPINVVAAFLLSIVTVGLYGLYVLYRINRYWWDAQVVEQDFDDQISQAWTKLDLIRYPITFTADQSKRRSYALYLILTIVTFGFFGIWWDSRIQVDPDNLYNEFHSIEDTVLQTVRAH
jgi:hypothetical protein